MSYDISNSNLNRTVTLSGTSITIFTFLLFLYPRYSSGEINTILFQFTLAVIVSVIFSLVISALYYYGNTLTLTPEPERVLPIFGRAEMFWLIGYSLLLLEPSLILFTVNLLFVGTYALFLWLVYGVITLVQYRKQTKKRSH